MFTSEITITNQVNNTILILVDIESNVFPYYVNSAKIKVKFSNAWHELSEELQSWNFTLLARAR